MPPLTQCKSVWTRILLKGALYADRHRRFDALYRVRDPWGLDCNRERTRFEATNAIVRREFGTVGSLLELGCGEGLQSAYLSAVCDRLFGVDVSSLAVKRARERCPHATFETGDITEFDQVRGQRPFDLVVACEMLYYVKDVRHFLDRMSKIGDACLVTYYGALRDKLDPEISLQLGVKSELIRHQETDRHQETEWIAAWWVNAHTPVQAT